MVREDIQATNPGAIRNRLADVAAANVPDDDDCTRHRAAIPPLKFQRNLPANLACAFGLSAVVLVLIGLFAQHYEPRWIGPLWVYLPLGGWFGSLLGVPAFFLGAAGAQPRWLQAADGFHWACIGMLLGVCAMLGAVLLFFEPMSKISGC